MKKKDSTTWSTGTAKSYPKLMADQEADVVIVGGGITGIWNAYILSGLGLKVILLEKNNFLLQNATLYTTAFISKIIDTSFGELVNFFGRKKANLIWQSGIDATQLISDTVEKEKIDCEFKFLTSYIYATNDSQFETLKDDCKELNSSGFRAITQIDKSKFPFENFGFMSIPMEATFNPVKFAEALAQKAESLGAKIFANSQVLEIQEQKVKTKEGLVKAKDIIIATYLPITNAGTHFKKAMYVSYVYELEIEKNILGEGLYLDMENPYHYFRVDKYPDFDRMIVGGEDHRKDIGMRPKKNFEALLEYINSILPGKKYRIKRRWQGNVLESFDGLPFIGEIKPHLFVATAFSGNGMTYSPISALIIRDLILKKKNPFTDLYDLKREFTLSNLTSKGLYYMEEFFGGAFRNYFKQE